MPGLKLKSSVASTKALVGIWTVTLTSFIIAALYFARDILIPVALATLLTFLLAPLVTRVQKWLGRVGAVLLVVFVIIGATGAGGWMLTSQLVDLADKLPDYQKNIQTKLRSFKTPAGGRFTRFTEAVEEIKKELPGVGSASPDTNKTAEVYPPLASQPTPAPVMENEKKSSPFHLARLVISPVLGPLGTAALVMLLVIFMLLKREDLRSRLIRLIGQGHISATTRAMDEAGARVARYLVMQLFLNLGYGACVAVGLYFIGVPNALLWGATAAALRFIPYVGPWIGAAIPVALALTVSPGWTMPLLTLGLFVALELLSNNVMEPWLYGSSTGVTPIALIFAALFWTWLWGPVGLVLATPMTVCLVVMGRHIPRLSFLGILLSDEEALTAAEDCYYRLLTVGEQDELDFVEAYVKANSLTALYDCVFIPVITRMENDYRLDLLDEERRAQLEQSLRDIVRDMGVTSQLQAVTENEGVEALPPATPFRVYCLPARATRDDLAGTMLMQLLRQNGFTAESAPANLGVEELISQVEKAEVDLVCISVVAPSTVLHARYLCLKLRARLPNQQIIVGLWGSTGNLKDATRRVQDSGADAVVSTLEEVVERVTAGNHPSPKAEDGIKLPVAA